MLSGPPRRRVIPEVAATADVVAEDPLSGFCGAAVACTSTAVTLEDRPGRRRLFPLEVGAFLVDGQQVTLVRPASHRRPARSCRRPVREWSPGLRARTARAARIWVEGVHDAALVERVWGHDLRVEGIVVEPIDGLDNLPAEVARLPARARPAGSGCWWTTWCRDQRSAGSPTGCSPSTAMPC